MFTVNPINQWKALYPEIAGNSMILVKIVKGYPKWIVFLLAFALLATYRAFSSAKFRNTLNQTTVLRSYYFSSSDILPSILL